MRSLQDREFLTSRFSDTIQVENFLSDSEVASLINVYNNSQTKLQKNTGPIVSSIMDDPLFELIKNRLTLIIGECKVYSANFFDVKFPHIIHNDDRKDLPATYKAITLPLQINYVDNVIERKNPALCIFDQYYLDGPAKFFNGDTFMPTYYNQQIYEYSAVQNKTSNIINEQFRNTYLSHLKTSWLSQLSIKSTHEWKIGSAIIFDALKLHCASDFRKLGITSKLGISIFTYTD